MQQLVFVQDLAVVLCCAGVAAWVSQRLGVSVIVGYLLAGIVVGPYTPPMSLVSGLQNVHQLANLGLVFVMFFVGLELSLPRLKSLGVGALLTTAATALGVLALSRFAAGFLGLGVTGGLFLGGVLVVSSSAIITKVLAELDATHEPAGQLALGITVLEDLVAVVMLAVLGSLAVATGDRAPSLPEVLGRMGAFVLLLLILGLLLVPRLLRVLRRSTSDDVQLVLVAGVLLAISWIAARAGYSVALGAFLLGSLLGGTQHKPGLERAFSSLRDLFAALFFVSMGMLFDVNVVLTAWPWVLALTGFAMAVRFTAATGALVLVGQPVGHAAQVGLSLLPLGEFSFVIAQLGVSSGLMPESFYPATVGAALFTTLLSPVLMRRGPAVARVLDAHEPRALRAWRLFLANAWAALRRRQERRPVVKMLTSRAIQLALEVAVVVSAIASSRLVFDTLDGLFREQPWHAWFPLAYWAAFGVVLLVPLLALWRNLGAVGMILGEALAEGSPSRARASALSERAMQAAGMTVTLLLAAAFLPAWATRPWVLAAVGALALALVLLLRPLLIRWYAQAQAEVRGSLAPAPRRQEAALPTVAERAQGIVGAPFGLKVHEHTLRDLSPAAGQTVAGIDLRRRFGCTLACIERQGLSLPAPGADAALFPNDRLLLVGRAEQIEKAEEWLASEAPGGKGRGYAGLVTEQLEVPAGAPCLDKTLRELAIARRFGVQVLGVMRDGRAVDPAAGEVQLAAGDWLLVLGSAHENKAFRDWVLGAAAGA